MRPSAASLILAVALAMVVGSTGNALATPCAPLPRASAANFLPRLTTFLNNRCYQKAKWQHDAAVRTSDGVHPFVKVWYSPQVFDWMTVNQRKGAIPNGAIIVKEMYPTLTAPLAEWTVMIKDANLSWDGWYWGELLNPSPLNPNAPPKPPRNGCAEPKVLLNGAGLYCLNCHASAIVNQSTYSSTEYMAPAAATSGLIRDFEMSPLKSEDVGALEEELTPEFIDRIPSSVFTNLKPLTNLKVPCMISEAQDHVVMPSTAHGGPQEFVTSDQCTGCHDATGTLDGVIPRMILQPAGGLPRNLSAAGEWRYSMMGLAGRDPVFFAQLDTESTQHRHLVGKPDGAAFVQDLCLRCHGVMGQRQFHLDNPDSKKLFTRDMMQNPRSTYGALARDGVSCAVCHHMTGDKLVDETTYTGLFNIGPPTELYGPYDDQVELPMRNAIGVTPMFALQFGPNNFGTKISGMCASCHIIQLPVFDRHGRPVLDEHGQPKTAFEQTTYFEWLNSSFFLPPTNQIACQQCHMPTDYHGDSLQFKIANIEDETFPAVPQTGPSTRVPDSEVALTERSKYGRHQLNGINLFVLEMFDQFRKDLGLFKANPNLPATIRDQISAQKTAVEEGVRQAQNATATVSVDSVSTDASTLSAKLTVTNLAGHNFPSGVSFRRAFVNFEVLDATGQVLWASGETNRDGVIVDNSGAPLTTEFFSPKQQTFQPHFWESVPITSDKQVQIFEELAISPEGSLTTSFLSFDHKVKDNRLQARGRNPNGPFGDMIAPVGTGDRPLLSGWMRLQRPELSDTASANCRHSRCGSGGGLLSKHSTVLFTAALGAGPWSRHGAPGSVREESASGQLSGNRELEITRREHRHGEHQVEPCILRNGNCPPGCRHRKPGRAAKSITAFPLCFRLPPVSCWLYLRWCRTPLCRRGHYARPNSLTPDSSTEPAQILRGSPYRGRS